jgi:hypothetical protein
MSRLPKNKQVKTKNSKLEGKDRDFFWDDSMDATIHKFNTCDNIDERNSIYNTNLKKKLRVISEVFFSKIFKMIHDETLINDAIGHCIMNLHHYKPDKGKSYAYVSFIFRNFYLQVHMKQIYQAKKLVSFNCLQGESPVNDGEYSNMAMEECLHGDIEDNKREISIRTVELVSLFEEFLTNPKNRKDIIKQLKIAKPRNSLWKDHIKIYDNLSNCLKNKEEFDKKKRSIWSKVCYELSPLFIQYLDDKGIEYPTI